jgi:DNA-binding transcriptional LysR family regulator
MWILLPFSYRPVHRNDLQIIMKLSFTTDLGQLKALCALADHGTVTSAAAALHLSPSAVSQQIAALSHSTGAPLVVRHGRRVRLTPQALVLVGHARVVEAQLERARSDLEALTEGQAGTVAVAAFATAITRLVSPALTMLAPDRPGLEVSVTEVEAPGCFRCLDDGTADIAITVDYRSGPRRGDPRYERIELLADPLLALLPSRHPLAGRRQIGLDALADESWVIGTPGHPCVEITEAALASASIVPRTCHRVNDWDAVIALVTQGNAVGLVPSLALPARLAGVVARPLRPPQPARNIYAAVRNGSRHAPHIAAMADALYAVATRA